MHESFVAARRRHRRSARLFTAVAAVPALAQSLPAALLLAPVCLGVAVLGADLLNPKDQMGALASLLEWDEGSNWVPMVLFLALTGRSSCCRCTRAFAGWPTNVVDID